MGVLTFTLGPDEVVITCIRRKHLLGIRVDKRVTREVQNKPGSFCDKHFAALTTALGKCVHGGHGTARRGWRHSLRASWVRQRCRSCLVRDFLDLGCKQPIWQSGVETVTCWACVTADSIVKWVATQQRYVCSTTVSRSCGTVVL